MDSTGTSTFSFGGQGKTTTAGTEMVRQALVSRGGNRAARRRQGSKKFAPRTTAEHPTKVRPTRAV